MNPTPNQGSLISAHTAANLLDVPEDVLRDASTHQLIPAVVLDGCVAGFTLDQLATIRGQGAAPKPPAESKCCIDQDLDGRRLWCRSCAAKYLALAPKTLANHHSNGSGPTVRGRQGAPRYRKADLDAWADDAAAA